MAYSTSEPVKTTDKDKERLKEMRKAAMAMPLPNLGQGSSQDKNGQGKAEGATEDPQKTSEPDNKNEQSAPDAPATSGKEESKDTGRKTGKAEKGKGRGRQAAQKEAGPASEKKQSCIRLQERTDMALRFYTAQSPYSMSQIVDLAVMEYLERECPEIFSVVNTFMKKNK
jgi:hypothetical protein